MTTAIAYPGGSYGTYLEWCLTTLLSDKEIMLPFLVNGNSHKFTGNQLSLSDLSDLSDFQQCKNRSTMDFVRFHPKIRQGESLCKNLNDACGLAKSVIYLYPDPGSMLLVINNQYTKIWKDWWDQRLKDPVFRNNLYTGWNIDQSILFDDIPIWIRREILSYNLMPSWFDEVEWGHLLNWSHTKSITVSVNELLYDFERTIFKIQKFCNLDFKKSIQQLVPAHYTMLSLQTFLDQDLLCNKFLAYTLNNLDMDFLDVPLPSQAWIQWQLRNNGFEIQCNGLDTFPTNSLQLRELLYPV